MRSGRGTEAGCWCLLVVVCAMVRCGRGVRLDGEALASPLSLICAGEAPASSRRRGTPAPDRRRLDGFGERRRGDGDGDDGSRRRAGRVSAKPRACRVRALLSARCSCRSLPLPRSLADACRPRACAGAPPRRRAGGATGRRNEVEAERGPRRRRRPESDGAERGGARWGRSEGRGGGEARGRGCGGADGGGRADGGGGAEGTWEFVAAIGTVQL